MYLFPYLVIYVFTYLLIHPFIDLFIYSFSCLCICLPRNREISSWGERFSSPPKCLVGLRGRGGAHVLLCSMCRETGTVLIVQILPASLTSAIPAQAIPSADFCRISSIPALPLASQAKFHTHTISKANVNRHFTYRTKFRLT